MLEKQGIINNVAGCLARGIESHTWKYSSFGYLYKISALYQTGSCVIKYKVVILELNL